MIFIKETPKLGRREILIDKEDSWLLEQYSFSLRTSKRYSGAYVHFTKKKANQQFRDKYLHRVIMEAKPGEVVDHINGNPSDNRRRNLRICTHAENLRNSKKRKGYKHSKYKGVGLMGSKHRRRKSWRARIFVDKKQITLGYFLTENEAAEAYNAAAQKYFKEFAILNNVVYAD